MHLGDIVLHVWCGAAWEFDAGEQRYTNINKEVKKKRVLQSVTTVFAMGQRPLFHAVTQSTVKRCNVKRYQSVSKVISRHRVPCGYIVHVLGIRR